MMLRHTLLGMLVLGAGGAAFAADSGAYVGGGVGYSDHKLSTDDGSLSGGDRHKGSASVYGGYQFNPNLAVEGGYVDLGKATADHTTGGGTTQDYSSKLSAWQASVIGSVPVADKVSLYGRLGAARLQDKWSDGSSSGTAHKTKPLIGVGVKYDINEKVALRGEYTDYGKISHDGESEHARVASVNVQYQF